MTAPVPTLPLSSAPDRTREFVRHELVRRDLTVLGRRQLTESLVRVTLGGAMLAGFTSLGPADHVKAFFPTPAGPAGRDYTPAEFRALGASGGPELDLDLVAHGDSGAASAWAGRAGAGDRLLVAGPRASRLAPAGFSDAVLVADASAAPAMRRWIRAFAGVLPIRALLFGRDHRLPEYFDDEETRVAGPRLVAEHGLIPALSTLSLTRDTFVWAAGEATELVAVRRWLKHDAGLPEENRVVSGYWRAGDGAFDHHAPLDPTDPD